MANNKEKTLDLPINGCLVSIILCALCGIAVKECERAEVRLQRDKLKLEQFKDSIENKKKKITDQNKDSVAYYNPKLYFLENQKTR